MGLIYSDIEAEIRNVLISDATIQNLLGVDSIGVLERIYVGHITDKTDPEYPCITFRMPSGGMNKNQFTINPTLYLDVWCKTQLDTAQNIYDRVRQLVNLKPIPNSDIAQIKEIKYNDDLYEKVTRTYHIATQYEVQAINR